MIPIDFLSDFNGNAGTSLAALDRLDLPKRLPLEYLQLLTQLDGGEGFIGASYVILYPSSELAEANKGYEFPKYLPGVFLIGSDGGGEGFAIDLRKSEPEYVVVPFIGAEESTIKSLGKSLLEFFQKLRAGDLLN